MDITQIRELRLSLGMTQLDLARQSNTSLATIQNIEVNRANPSIEVLSKILISLSATLRIVPQTYDYDRIAALGAPILGLSKKVKIEKSVESLVREIRYCFYDLSVNQNDEHYQRNYEALMALVLAIHSHYPKVYKLLKKAVPMIGFPKKIDGRMIKLRRISLGVISSYL